MGAQLLSLFDFYWFQHLNLSNSQSPPHPDLQFHVPFKELYSGLSHLLSLRAVIFLSDDEQFLSSQESFISDDSLSPSSVLQGSKLRRMFSREEIGEGYSTCDHENDRRRRRGSRKRLWELEMEEVKGFMDMGFVFSEEDKNSWLVSLVPGVKRLGREDEDHDHEEEEEDGGENIEECKVSRPYLSEAWGVLDRRRRRRRERMDRLLMNWRIPDSDNEMDMKDHLRVWAHTVASAVR